MLYKIGFFIFFWTSLVSAEYDLESSKLRKINDYFHNCPLAVISTIDEFQKSSESALIAFAQNDDLELYFVTFVDSRKYVNLLNNQSVSLVIGFDYTTVQYQGIACALRETAIKEALYAFSLKETPCSSDFLNDPELDFLRSYQNGYDTPTIQFVLLKYLNNLGRILCKKKYEKQLLIGWA